VCWPPESPCVPLGVFSYRNTPCGELKGFLGHLRGVYECSLGLVVWFNGKIAPLFGVHAGSTPAATPCCFVIKMWDPIRIYAASKSPLAAPDIVWFVRDLSAQGGYPFVFLAHQGIYNAFCVSMSVFRVCCMCLCSFVRLWRSPRFCVFICWTLINTQRPLINTLSVLSITHTLPLSFIYTWRVFPKHLKKLSALKPANKRPPNFSLINLNKKLARKHLFLLSSFHRRNNFNEYNTHNTQPHNHTNTLWKQ